MYYCILKNRIPAWNTPMKGGRAIGWIVPGYVRGNAPVNGWVQLALSIRDKKGKLYSPVYARLKHLKGYKPEVVTPPVEPPILTGCRFAWDDEIPDYNNKCRTQMPGYVGPKSPPAVLRFFPVMKENAGDFRVNIVSWKQFFLDLNDGDMQDFDYWTGPATAQFNQTGFPMLAYLGMSGNRINVLETVNGWVKFETLKASEIPAKKMTHETDPCFIHSFHCIGFRDGQTVRIESTNTARGKLYYPLVTKEGFAYIPARFVVKA